MEISNINLAYFSATFTTKKVVRLIAGQINGKVTEYDITQNALENDIISGNQDLLIVGIPVYSGRIPAKAVDVLNKFKGNGGPAIIACIYGNRDYDDALLELKDIVEANGFKVISAGAFVAQHAIFPQVGISRPDNKDIALIKEFAGKSLDMLNSKTDMDSLPAIKIKGNHPYKTSGKIPLQPKGDKKCNECKTCVKQCPVQAIHESTPRKTDRTKCIACGRCIVVCPQHARHFGGILYKLAGRRFVKANSRRKEPEMYFA